MRLFVTRNAWEIIDISDIKLYESEIFEYIDLIEIDKFEEHKKYGSFRVYCDNYDCRIMPRTLWYCGADDAASAWNKRAERTCQRVDENGYSFRFKCSACGYASLVHNCETRLDELPRYCPNCGAKVVSE